MAGSKAANTNESVHVGMLILLVRFFVRVCVLSGYLCLCAGILMRALSRFPVIQYRVVPVLSS